MEDIYNVLIDHSVGAPGHERELNGSLNPTDKTFIVMLMKNVQLPGASGYGKYMTMHTSTVKKDINISREFQKYLSYQSRKNDVMDQDKYI